MMSQSKKRTEGAEEGEEEDEEEKEAAEGRREKVARQGDSRGHRPQELAPQPEAIPCTLGVL